MDRIDLFKNYLYLKGILHTIAVKIVLRIVTSYDIYFLKLGINN